MFKRLNTSSIRATNKTIFREPQSVLIFQSKWYSLKSNNRITTWLNYVHEVDQRQKELEQTPESQKIISLMNSIEDKPELVYILAAFLHDLKSIGIDQNNDPEVRTKLKWKFRVYYLLKLLKMHNVFWEQCRFLEMSQHRHILNFDPVDIGLLDPSNFPKDVFDELQSGKYKSINLKTIDPVGVFARNPFRD
ncbi:Piso0_000625 [Millerozyma farinosa CBS 7064]|uniref:Piso0_000625 protein n=1 Tax=Pichia sorbitophila (strain ATCC MYA-4447 / BCRC 22081 / CBS 7064 / NBRC 10061 / NRRL Y-12695) TaxID=559304 RepID=G8YR26_PICSO|nr:Piso0_000625 [Millerozyma farinosa CBS 7064]